MTTRPDARCSRMPGYLIRRAQQIAVAVFVEECAALDLTPVQYAALSAVTTHPGIDATRLAGLIAFDKPTTGGVLDRLEAKGLIERKQVVHDRRVRTIAATAAGKRLLKRADGPVRRAQERILAPLQADERAIFLQLLTRLVDASSEALRDSPRRVREPA